MKLAEAYQVLELDSSASQEDIKKQFRKLAAKYHPDKNKDPGAEIKAKQISEAYTVLQDPSKAEPEFNPFGNQAGNSPGGWGFGIDLGDIFNFVSTFIDNDPAPTLKTRSLRPIKAKLDISFAECVLGSKKKISFQRAIKCDDCNGLGRKVSSDKCSDCNGKGRKREETKNGNRIIVRETPCGGCLGIGKKSDPCKTCEEYGNFLSDSSFDVNIPAGIDKDLVLRGAGHFNTQAQRYEDVLLKINVIPSPNMKLKGNNVISEVEVELLSALEGKTITVNTVLGEKQLSIPPKTKHLDNVSLPNLGVNGKGNHNFIISVKYPDDCSKLIQMLKES